MKIERLMERAASLCYCLDRTEGRLIYKDIHGAVGTGNATDVVEDTRSDAPIGLLAAARPEFVFAPSQGH